MTHHVAQNSRGTPQEISVRRLKLFYSAFSLIESTKISLQCSLHYAAVLRCGCIVLFALPRKAAGRRRVHACDVVMLLCIPNLLFDFLDIVIKIES